MPKKLSRILIYGFCGLLLASAPLSMGSLTSTPATVALAATKPQSISITLTTPGPVDFSLNGGTTTGSVTPAWTTNWNLDPSETNVQVCVYLSGALTGTGGNTDTIPPANVLGSADGTGPMTALTGTACGQSNALSISNNTITLTNRKNGSANDSVSLEINEASPAITLSPDTYSGTLNIIAQATP